MLKNLSKLQRIKQANMRHRMREKLAYQVRKINTTKDFISLDEDLAWLSGSKLAH